jgi:hypothetical protein
MKTNKTRTSITSKIRRALREMQSGQDAIFSYDREFRA